MNSRSKTVSFASGVILVLGLGVSTVRADSVHVWQFLESNPNWGHQKQMGPEGFSQREDIGYFQREHSDNGKHLGFSVARLGGGSPLTVVGYNNNRQAATATPNPEPATMVLFGTGLIALGAYARRKYR